MDVQWMVNWRCTRINYNLPAAMVDISSIIEGTVKFRDGKKVNWDWDQMKKASNINRTGTKRILFISLHPLIIINEV